MNPAYLELLIICPSFLALILIFRGTLDGSRSVRGLLLDAIGTFAGFTRLSD
jgi:hypothetical protein